MLCKRLLAILASVLFAGEILLAWQRELCYTPPRRTGARKSWHQWDSRQFVDYPQLLIRLWIGALAYYLDLSAQVDDIHSAGDG